MIVGLVSCFREGRLVRGAIRSLLPACDLVLVAEGPVGGSDPSLGEPSQLDDFAKLQNVIVHRGSSGHWPDDAGKRDWLLQRTRRYSPPVWAVWLDGDELLVNGEYLPDYLRRLEYGGETGKVVGGFGIRLVELDGTISRCSGKVVRADLIARYLVSSFQVELVSPPGFVLAVPNVPETESAWAEPRQGHDRLFVRPPLPGEPFILHRSALRPPGRAERRLHRDEADWFSSALPAGLA